MLSAFVECVQNCLEVIVLLNQVIEVIIYHLSRKKNQIYLSCFSNFYLENIQVHICGEIAETPTVTKNNNLAINVRTRTNDE